MWDSFQAASAHVSIPWIVAGNFNDLASPSEKVGGTDFSYHKSYVFNQRINACNLMDLGFKGSPFTWKGKRRGGALVYE